MGRDGQRGNVIVLVALALVGLRFGAGPVVAG